MKGGPVWNKIAAATGLDFAVIGVVLFILARNKGFPGSGDFVRASNEMWGAYVLLLGLATVLFLWFTSIFATRLHQVETALATSGRLARAVFASGATIAGAFAVAIAAHWGARELEGDDLAALATGILDGPVLALLAAVYVGAAALAVYRAGPAVSPPSRVLALIGIPLAAAYIALAGLKIFYNLAWIDETVFLTFVLWVGGVSAVGIQRWGEIDGGWMAPAPRAAAPEAPAPAPAGPEPLPGPERGVTASAPVRKPARRKSTARKTPARKPAAKKATSRKKPGREPRRR